MKIKQQVNLYKTQFHPKKERFSIGQCLAVVILGLSVFAALTGLKMKQINDIEQEISTLDQKHKQMMEQLSSIAEVNSKNKKKAVKKSEVKSKEQELKGRRELLSSLVGGKYGSKEGFSEYMVALSRQHVEGAWITGLAIQNGGDQLAISGSALEPELAPIYLQNLSNENVFTGKSFSVLELNRKEVGLEEGEIAKPEKIDFIFRTNGGDQVEALENES